MYNKAIVVNSVFHPKAFSFVGNDNNLKISVAEIEMMTFDLLLSALQIACQFSKPKSFKTLS